MILGVTLLVISLSLLLVYNPSAVWRMFSFLFRSGEATTRRPHDDDIKDFEKPTRSPGTPARDRPLPSVTKALRSRESSPDTTPKATAQTNGAPVPSFSLSGPVAWESDNDDDDDDHLPPPQFPALNSAQRAGSTSSNLAGAVPSVPSPTLKVANILMPPPPLPRGPPRSGLSVPSAASSLRIPSNGPLPNRGPPTSMASSLGVPLSSAVKTPNPRKKVLLQPGHSPLDWANLLKSGRNLSGVDKLLRVTPSLLKQYNGRRGRPAWASYQGKVYNISPYLPYHPGGEGELKRAAGKDGEKLFMEVHPWVNWDNMLADCLVGIMVSENDAPSQTQMEEMD